MIFITIYYKLMKNIIAGCVFTLFFYSAYASCILPLSIENKNIMMANTAPYTPNNPMAGTFYFMHYKANHQYSYEILQTGHSYNGMYTYQRLADNVAIIVSNENFEGVPTQYTLTLICENSYSGSYVYQQALGVGGMRSNYAQYFFIK